MSGQARFEIVRSEDQFSPRVERGLYRDDPQPWHARFVAANGRIVFSSEQYARRSGAEKAIRSLLDVLSGGRWVKRVSGEYDLYLDGNEMASDVVEVRDVDERGRS